MPDTTPASPERTVVVSPRRSLLITILTIANSVVLALIIVGLIVHHHRMKHEHEHGFARGGRDGGDQCEYGFHDRFHDGFRGGFHHFRHFGYGGGPGFDRQGGFGQDRFGGPGGDSFGFHHGMGGMGMGNRGGMDMPRGGMGAGMTGNPDQMTDAILQHLSTQLSLTDDQKVKIKPLVQADVVQFQKNAQTLRDAMQKQFQDAKAQIRPLLNADQQKQLDALPTPGQKPAEDDGQNSPAPK
jgi:hypothetical protein